MQTASIDYRADGSFQGCTGPDAVAIYRAAVVRSSLRMHVATNGRMRSTRNASPSNLMAIAKEITGAKLKARDYDGAVVALDQWITEAKTKVLHLTDGKPLPGAEVQIV